MPDLPELPITWRPLGARLAGWIFGLALLAVCAAAWLTFDDEVKDAFSWSQRITMLALGVCVWSAFYALMRCRVQATEDGLTIVNGYRTRVLDWAQVVSVHLPAGAPWATLDLSDGTTVSAMGIQGSDGARALRVVRDLRALLEAHQPRDG